MIFLQVDGVQAGKPIHPPHKTPRVSDERPVSASEAREVFIRVGELMLKVTGVPLGTPAIPSSERPVTREEIVAEMTRFYQGAERTIRFIPAHVPYDPEVISIRPSTRTSLERLVGLGLVGKVSPLAVGPGSGLTPRQLGDAVGMFVDRMAQLTHMPSPKWTPMLKED